MTKIEWTEHTWNPIIGCSKAKGSLGCQQCYAINQAYRNEAIAESLVSDGKNPGRLANYQGLTEKRGNRIEWTGKVVFVPEALLVPLKRKKPTMYFVNSMSDLFHESVEFEWIDQIFAVMAICQQHTFQILTKRPERMERYVDDSIERIVEKILELTDYTPECLQKWDERGETNYDFKNQYWPLTNVWLGVTVEDQKAVERISFLEDLQDWKTFVSVEPLLEQVNLFDGNDFVPDWIIVGGESGNKARPCYLDWIRSIIHQCKKAETPVFVKQLGSNPIDSSPYGDSFSHFPLKLKHSKGADIEEFPEDLKIRQFPN